LCLSGKLKPAFNFQVALPCFSPQEANPNQLPIPEHLQAASAENGPRVCASGSVFLHPVTLILA
jgi:hypothetical protein